MLWAIFVMASKSNLTPELRGLATRMGKKGFTRLVCIS